MLQEQQLELAKVQGLRIDVQSLLGAYLDAETGQRGYLLTGDESYLEPYERASKELEYEEFEESDSLAPQTYVRKLREELREYEQAKLTELQRVLEINEESGVQAAIAEVQTNEGREAMRELRDHLAATDANLAKQSRKLLEDAEETRKSRSLIGLIDTIILALGLVFFLGLVLRYLAQRDRSLREAAAARDELAKSLASERAAHSEVAHANQLKDEFLAVVSHELRTPLNAMLGWTSLLRQGVDDEAELKEGLETIDRNARAQGHLIDDLLDVSRIITGKVRLQIKQVDMRIVVVGVVEGLRPAADARGITIDVRATSESMFVLGDVDRLQQVVWNLLSNATKFAPKSGSVTVNLAAEGSHVILDVRDNGPGISDEFLPRLFERFSQQDSGTARNKTGLGLGLAITRHLVELHGGTISAENAATGTGAIFTVKIPVLAVSELQKQPGVLVGDQYSVPVAASVPAPEKSDGKLQGARVLVVDDQRDTVTVMTRVLSRAGAEVKSAPSVAKGLEIFDQPGWRPDVVLSDIGMPDEDGYSFIRKIREHSDPVVQKVKAVALTAFARDRDRQLAIDAGFNEHLAKPVDSVALVRKVSELLDRR
ncbi:MAG: ATP-binding protein [Chthoniobacterales bacterium]